MTEHEPLASRWRRSVVTAHDLLVRTADADDQSFDEESAGTGPRVRRFDDLDSAGLLGNDGESSHIKAYPFAGVSQPFRRMRNGKPGSVTLVLAFGVVLLISVSLSGIAARTVLSTAVLFLVAGAAIGHGGFGLVDIPSDGMLVRTVADLALFTVLFTDGQRAGLPALRQTWRLCGRAVGLGMPLTMAGIAVLVHLLTGLDWATSFLVGAVLPPPIRCSRPLWSAATTCRCGCAACSTSSPA